VSRHSLSDGTVGCALPYQDEGSPQDDRDANHMYPNIDLKPSVTSFLGECCGPYRVMVVCAILPSGMVSRINMDMSGEAHKAQLLFQVECHCG
jgi:hypothetical protein